MKKKIKEKKNGEKSVVTEEVGDASAQTLDPPPPPIRGSFAMAIPTPSPSVVDQPSPPAPASAAAAASQPLAGDPAPEAAAAAEGAGGDQTAPAAAAATGASLYVGDLEASVGEDQLVALFSQVAPVASAYVCRDIAGGRKSLGYGYVNFMSREDG